MSVTGVVSNEPVRVSITPKSVAAVKVTGTVEPAEPVSKV